jgi:hypothetical protein
MNAFSSQDTRTRPIAIAKTGAWSSLPKSAQRVIRYCRARTGVASTQRDGQHLNSLVALRRVGLGAVPRIVAPSSTHLQGSVAEMLLAFLKVLKSQVLVNRSQHIWHTTVMVFMQHALRRALPG